MSLYTQKELNQMNIVSRYLPDLIKGEMTISQVSTKTGLSVHAIVSFLDYHKILSDYRINFSLEEIATYNNENSAYAAINNYDKARQTSPEELQKLIISQRLDIIGELKRFFPNSTNVDFEKYQNALDSISIDSHSYDIRRGDGNEYTVFINAKLGYQDDFGTEFKIGFVNQIGTNSVVDRVEIEGSIKLGNISSSFQGLVIWDEVNREILVKNNKNEIKSSLKLPKTGSGKVDISIGIDSNSNISLASDISATAIKNKIPLVLPFPL
ncbi:hypothetical protein [Anabaena sp. AL09]|uniref:hypothetical protein n=1 Tax=Anabaena sp. AL09 TaxID=1710891 RepID=UPI0008000C4E|nr:hypothetical protein [Anabaena sp. AL09]OBQ04218.1 MAG: hypothetical protein AN490_16765 [Anabaena sp. AL09]